MHLLLVCVMEMSERESRFTLRGAAASGRSDFTCDKAGGAADGSAEHNARARVWPPKGIYTSICRDTRFDV